MNCSKTYLNFCAGMNSLKDVPDNNMEAVLVSATEILKSEKSFKRTTDIIDKSGARWVMMDSGGFSILNVGRKNGIVTFDASQPFAFHKRELNISPRHVIEAALKLHPDIMIGLDYPIIKTSDPELQVNEFHNKRELNHRWMQEISNLRKMHCPEIELYLPIQCYNLDQLSYFEDDLMSLEFDGIALPTRNMTPKRIVNSLIRIHEMGITRIHLLGTSSFSNIALSVYLARNLFDRCTVDGTTWRTRAQYHDYINPGTLLKTSVGRKFNRDKGAQLPCRCKVCRGRTFGDIVDLSNKERINFLRTHNYNAVKRTGEDFYRHAGDLEGLRNYLKRKAPERMKDINSVVHALEIVDHDLLGRNIHFKAA